MANEFWSKLTLTEKIGVAVGAGLADTRVGRRLATEYQNHMVVPVLGQTINNRLHTEGLQHVPQDASFIFAANHRSYFDLYAVMLACWPAFDRPPHLYCPVRTTFFYETPQGVLLNLAVCGNAMYPPVFRDRRGKVLNRYAVDRAVHLLQTDPRCIVAMHPEGKRNPGDDPYQYLPPKPGIGRIALRARRPILPVYVGGLPPSFGQLIKDRVSPDGTPVRVRIGPPVDVSDLRDPGSPEAHREVAQRTMAAVAALGELDRAAFAT